MGKWGKAQLQVQNSFLSEMPGVPFAGQWDVNDTKLLVLLAVRVPFLIGDLSELWKGTKDCCAF